MDDTNLANYFVEILKEPYQILNVQHYVGHLFYQFKRHQ
jgi:hypothetical protein